MQLQILLQQLRATSLGRNSLRNLAEPSRLRYQCSSVKVIECKMEQKSEASLVVSSSRVSVSNLSHHVWVHLKKRLHPRRAVQNHCLLPTSNVVDGHGKSPQKL